MNISAYFVKRGCCSYCKIMEICLFFLVSSLLQLVQSDGQGKGPCVQTDSCTCKFSDGSVISLATLANPSIDGPRFNFTLATEDPYLYAYNPCNSFSWQESTCQNVAGCQLSQNGKNSFDIGDQKNAKFNDAGTTITYTAISESVTRTLNVNLNCDSSATEPIFTAVGEKPTGSLIYTVDLKSNCACPNGCIGGGISPGSILCILFSVVVILYVVIGVLFLKFVRGAEGKELIPNYEFWKDLPILIKDGVLFVASGFKGDSNNYEQI